MKRIAVLFANLLVVATAGLAGPEPIATSGKEMKEVAPVPPPCPSWTGFYVGGFGGYKFASTDIDLSLGGSEWDLFSSERGDVEKVGRHDLDNGSGEAGGFIGYNYQWKNWVFGVEASAAYLWISESRSTDFFSNHIEYLTDTSLESNYVATFAPRVGVALCKWMPYVTGGLAIGDINFRQHIVGLDLGADQGGKVDDTNIGWMVGGGLEYSLTDHWRLRAQYQYIDLGSAGFDHSVNLPVFTGHSEAELREHNASFALIFQF